MNEATPLPRVSQWLLKHTGSPGPGYIKLYKLATSGAFPVEWRNGRIYVRNADLPLVANAVGLGECPAEVAA
jgi:hypothetical protein